MSVMNVYNYSNQRPALFTEEGQVMFMNIRDHVLRILKTSGAITMGKAMDGAKSGESWTMLACVDRMVELGELVEIKQGDIPGQWRVFVPKNRDY